MYSMSAACRRKAVFAAGLTACAVWLALWAGSCGPLTQPDTAGDAAALRNLDSLVQLPRITSADGDFLPYQNGADFATDLPYNRCEPSGLNAVLSPSYAGSHAPLTDAAYCLYRMELDPAASDATLTLEWDGPAPGQHLGWIGLSNWSRGVWEWHELTGSDLALSTPADYADSTKRCFAAIVVLGATPVELASISFGPLPVPRGYTLFSPMQDRTTYLIDDQGVVVHTWEGEYTPGARALLAESGLLWRQVNISNSNFQLGGKGGRLEAVDWAGNVVWSFELSTATQCTHHDFALLPDGNVLLTVWNWCSQLEVIGAGRDPSQVGTAGLIIDSIVEIQPTGDTAVKVWQWFAMDHLVQDFDAKAKNYGDPAAHPELIDFNYTTLQGNDWTHINSIDYNAELDQIALSPLCLSELWVIDHSTTMEEAAGHSGGRYGRGGDLLYRWGNPQSYRAGTDAERQLFGQHNVHWIPAGLEGAGNLLIFNNLAGTPEGLQYSTAVELVTPLNPDGSYYMTDSAYGPAAPFWTYKADPPTSFFGLNMSGVQRLPGGNTLISIGPTGKFFEVTPGGETVWQYSNTHPSGRPSVFRAIRYPVDYPGLANLPQ